MKRKFLTAKLPLLLVISALVVTVTFAQKTSDNDRTSDSSSKKIKKIRDLDEALLELDKGEMELSRAMKEIDMEKMEREIRASLKDLDIDMSKMKEEISRAMKEIDFAKINIEMQKALKEVDAEKIQKEVQEAIAKIDTKKMQAELEKINEIDLSQMKLELENIRPEIERSMKEAGKEIEQARKQITSYKNLVNALDKDGLLDKTQNYKVEYKNKELTVNGKKLSADAVRKYNEYLADKENFTIQKESDNLNID